MGTYDLSGKTVLVTGGETGNGRAIALRTLTDGANVAAAGINTELLDETLTLAHDVGPAERMAALPVDIRDVDQVQKMVDDTVMKSAVLMWSSPMPVSWSCAACLSN